MKINHSKNDLNAYYKFLFFLCVPFVLYGLYKNSLVVYLESKDFFLLLKPIISLGLALGFGIFMYYKITKLKKINRHIISALFLWMILPFNTPLWLYIIGFVVLCLVMEKFDSFVHPILISKLICIIILFLLSKYTYQNYYEASGLYAYSFTDLFFKNQVGGVATSNLVLVVIIFIILLFNSLYKKNISISALASYIITMLLFAIFSSNNSIYFGMMISASVLFEILMLAPLNEYSSYTLKGQVIYGLFVGGVGAVICALGLPYDGVAIAILVGSLFKNIFDKKFELN